MGLMLLLAAIPCLAAEGSSESRDELSKCLMKAPTRAEYSDVRGLLVKGPHHDAQIADGETATGEAAIKEDAKIVRPLLAEAPLRDEDDDGTTPLMTAAEAGNLAEVKRLIAAGADVNAQNIHYMTPLNAAIGGGAILKS